MEIKELITRKRIKKWLENYDRLHKEDKSVKEVRSNQPAGGGVANSRIIKIMINEALQEMKGENYELYLAVKCRWVEQRTWKEAKEITGTAKGTYYYRTNVMAVDFIYEELNGSLAGYKDLLEAILT